MSVECGVEVVIRENHVNRAAPSGWMESLVRLVLLCYSAPILGKLRTLMTLKCSVRRSFKP